MAAVPAGPATETIDLPSDKTWLGHPVGLFLLFLVEMWERFSYYGMRALLVLYLIARTTGDENGFNPGRGWSESEASSLYGWYTGLAYLFPIFGGMIADKFIGTHRSMLVGGTLISIGHIILGISGLGDLEHSAAGMSLFITGLAAIVLGTGHFKPTVSVMVGQLYRQGDPRRDGAFTIFYMGINLGAFLCAFICGTLGEKVGWHWGFGSAAVGMILGMVIYMIGRPTFLGRIGEAPRQDAVRLSWMFLFISLALSAAFGWIYHAGALNALQEGIATLKAKPALWNTIVGATVLAIVGWAVMFIRKNAPEDRGPVATILIFMLFNAMFWLAFEQAGSSINVFTNDEVNREVPFFPVASVPGDPASPKVPFVVPTTWFQSVNAAFIILLAPIMSAIWVWLGRRKMNPSQPMKIFWGLSLLGFGYLFTVWAGVLALGDAKAPMWLIVATYFWHTVGELCVSPTGLSYVTKAAPKQYVSLLMGLYFVSSFIANLGGGLVAAQVEAVEKGEMKLPWSFGGRADFFFLFVVTSFGAAALVLAMTPWLKKMMRSTAD
ncbi:Di-/tripeptide transporter [Caulifigura coniformis]|uniref:Di-/tripeptide transporter n=1 Tax=Caulifigura coniformis TaxID=2527983 RepID=A0A517SLZ9_9PLAN|nr:peptide MFS transporter [Caulifigura coniformis]QDT57157.1 Di-/tripeptide transporter [Caulifigura coniformis]